MKFLKFIHFFNINRIVLVLCGIVIIQNNQAIGQTRICNSPSFTKGCNSAAIASIAIVDATKDTVFSYISKTVCDKPQEVPAISTIALKPNTEYTLYVKTATTGYSIGAFLSNDGDIFYNETGVDNVINLMSSTTNGASAKFTVTGLNGGTLRMRIISSVGKRSYVLNDACTGADFVQGEFEDYVFNIRNCFVPRIFSAGTNDTICAGGFDTLNGTFLNRHTAQWSPSNLVLLPANPSTNTSALNATTTFRYTAINDTNRCRYTDQVTIYVNPTPSTNSTITEFQKGNRCPYPGNVLKINLDPKTTASLNYQWYNKNGLIKGATKNSYTATTTDTYYATIQYKKSCAVTKLNSISLDFYPTEQHTIAASSNVLCPKGSVTLKSSLIPDSYRFIWAKISKPLTANIDDTVAINGGNKEQLTVSDTGRYILLAYNTATGCLSFNKEGSIKIIPSPLSVSIAKQNFNYCPNSFVAIRAVYKAINPTFQWMYASTGLPIPSNSNKEVYNASESTYIYVKVTDANCAINSDTIHPQLTELFKVKLSTSADCKGGNVRINSNYNADLASYGFKYQWYADKIGNSISLTEAKSTNYPYSISPSKVDVKYFLKVTSRDSLCSETAAIVVPTKIKIFSILADKDTICEGGDSYLTTNITPPPTNLRWTLPDKTTSNATYVSAIAEGLYKVSATITDINQSKCLVEDSIKITALKRPTITTNLKYSDTTVCTPSVVTLELIGDTKDIKSYGWINYGEITVEGATKSIFEASQSGEYTAFAIGINGCRSTLSKSKTVIISNTPPAASWSSYDKLERKTTQICFGDSIATTITSFPTANEMLTLSLLLNNKIVKPRDSFGNSQFLYTKAGRYTARVVDQNTGCVRDTLVQITSYALPQIRAIKDSTFCTGSSFLLSTTFGLAYKYLWKSDNGTISDATLNETNLTLFSTFIPKQINVTLQVTDQVSSCVAVDTFKLTVIPNFTLTSKTGPPECSGGLGYAKAIIFGGTAPFKYSWSDANNQTTDSIAVKSGIYSVSVKDSRGCNNSAPQVIVQDKGFSNIKIDTIKLVPPTCGNIPNGEIEIGATNIFGKSTIKWTLANVTVGSTLKLTNLKSGNYQVTISDSLGCKTASFEFADPIPATAGSIGSDKSLYVGTPMPLILNVNAPKGNQNLKIQWQKSENKQTWDTIPGANQIDYSPTDLTVTTSFRRMVTDACSTYFSNVVTYTMRPPLPDSISGKGKVGSLISIIINSTYKSPYTVQVRITPALGQGGQLKDTTIIFPNNTFSFASKREGIYTLLKVNGLDVSTTAKGTATIGNIGALLADDVILGQPLSIVFNGNPIFKVKIYYNYYATPQSNPIKDSVILDNELSKFVPTQTGRYELLSLIDGNGKQGQAIGSANVNPVFNLPTADIKGGGYVGSIITVVITPNSGVGPWQVEILLDEMPYDTKQSDGLTFQFPSEKPGKYKIKSVNGNRRGNGEAVVITINPLPDLNSVFVWNAVSPDGDGKNDNFVIQIPLWLDSLGFKFDLDIFDREGTFLKKLHEVDAAALGTTASNDMLEYKWNCKNENGELLTPGTYFFSFKINDDASKNKPTKSEKEKANKSGFLEIRR